MSACASGTGRHAPCTCAKTCAWLAVAGEVKLHVLSMPVGGAQVAKTVTWPITPLSACLASPCHNQTTSPSTPASSRPTVTSTDDGNTVITLTGNPLADLYMLYEISYPASPRSASPHPWMQRRPSYWSTVSVHSSAAAALSPCLRVSRLACPWGVGQHPGFQHDRWSMRPACTCVVLPCSCKEHAGSAYDTSHNAHDRTEAAGPGSCRVGHSGHGQRPEDIPVRHGTLSWGHNHWDQ